jgi:YVTN family beta-propeller protein
MTSSRESRAITLGAAMLLCGGALAQNGPAQKQPVQKPGVPGIQMPMSYLIPDAQYTLEANGVKGGPDWLAIAEGSVWTNSMRTDTIFRMDPMTDKVLGTLPVKRPCSGFAIGAGTLWAPSCGDAAIYRVDLKTNQIVGKVPVGPANNEGGIAFGAGSAWMPSDPKGVVSRIDPATNTVTAEISVPPDSFTAVYNYGRVWVSSTQKSVVTVIGPASNKVIAEIPVGANPRFMAAGEGYVWTLNQGDGTVTRIDPRTMKVVATINVGLPGPGGDIATGEGAVWVTQKTVPMTRIDVATNRVTTQLNGPGGDAMRIGFGSVWLSNGKEGRVWRFLPQKVMFAGKHSWTEDAQASDLDGDGAADLLVEDLPAFIPGGALTLHMKLLHEGAGSKFVLKTQLNGVKTETPFVATGDEFTATLASTAPRWIHYSVCLESKCTPELVVASPTTNNAYATGSAKFVPSDFMAPPPPSIRDYVWNILEPEILDQDYDALMHATGSATKYTLTKAEDYGELKRHRWEFQRQTSFAYGILTADGTQELACVYVNPSRKQGYEATIRILMTAQGEKEDLQPLLLGRLKEWVKASWPFTNVAWPGLDMTTQAWNALPDAGR